MFGVGSVFIAQEQVLAQTPVQDALDKQLEARLGNKKHERSQWTRQPEVLHFNLGLSVIQTGPCQHGPWAAIAVSHAMNSLWRTSSYALKASLHSDTACVVFKRCLKKERGY